MNPKKKFTDVDYNLDVGDPPQELIDYAREKWGETEETRQVKIAELRHMVQEKEEVDPIRTDDAFLLRFLRARRFNIGNSYELLTNYCRFREDNPDFHEDVHPTDYLQSQISDIVAALPYREQTGRRVIIYKIGEWNPSEIPVVDMFRFSIILLEMSALEQRTQILGGICIFDLENVSLSHAWQLTPTVATQFIQILATCFPLKIYALHIIFGSWVFDIIFNVFKPFLNEAMKSRLHFHGSDVGSLHKHIDPMYLPKKYGGMRSDTFHYKKWIHGFYSTSYIFNELKQLDYKFDEKELSPPVFDSDSETDSEEEATD